MKEKMKELVTELFEGIVLFVLMASFVLGFIFVDNYFFPCVCVGILATITTAAICFRKDVLCE